MKVTLSEFLKDHFNNLKLEPPLFYSSPYGIRFEIAIPWIQHEDKLNLRQIEERSTGIFNKVFHHGDDVLLITDIHCEENDRGCDVIASRKEDLLPLYHELNKWILDYDREEIDGVFG